MRYALCFLSQRGMQCPYPTSEESLVATQPYRRPSRMYSGPMEAIFPLNLSARIALPAGATFKSLSLDAIHIHYTRDRMVEHQFPNDMRSFNRCTVAPHLLDLSPEAVMFVGGAWFDEAADGIAGLVPAVDFRLEYDPATGIIKGTITPQCTPMPDGVTAEPSPVTLITLGYCLQYYPADS